jgi:hypothetical protein
MRIAGALILIVGWVAAAVFLLLPVRTAVLGTPVDCGLPVVTALRGAPQDLVDEDTARMGQWCHDRSRDRALLGGVVWAITTVGGVAMLTLGSGQPAAQPLGR